MDAATTAPACLVTEAHTVPAGCVSAAENRPSCPSLRAMALASVPLPQLPSNTSVPASGTLTSGVMRSPARKQTP